VETRELGRTGIAVSVLGLGCGGFSRLGRSQGADDRAVIRLVQSACDAGVTLIDTAPSYGTEAVVGRALEGRRHEVVLSTKVTPVDDGGEPQSPAAVARSVHESLGRLRTDYLDIVHLHAVTPDLYDHCTDALLPELRRLQAAGAVRAVGVTERPPLDPDHTMLSRAVVDDCWDVVMVCFNFLNQSARRLVLRETIDRGVGALGMFAVRRAIADPQALLRLLHAAVGRGALERRSYDTLARFLRERYGDGAALVEDAYRFCAFEPGIDAVLTGTGSSAHLAENVAAVEKGPPDADLVSVMRELLGSLAGVTGQESVEAAGAR
jgi:aryl-alcohol dehydrogenase-like predicted oxidoreductase